MEYLVFLHCVELRCLRGDRDICLAVVGYLRTSALALSSIGFI